MNESGHEGWLKELQLLADRPGDTSAGAWFAALNRDRLRYCHPWGKWLVWDGRRWKRDDGGTVESLAKAAVRKMFEASRQLSEDPGIRVRGEAAALERRAGRLRAMIELARSDLPIRPTELDQDPWVLNVRNGTIDLRTGAARPHSPADHITKLAPVEFDPAATCPTWESFVRAILPDEATVRFFQRWAGYCLTGSTSEQVLVMAIGDGANGKTTAINAVADVLGPDYALRATPELVMVRRSEGHPTDRADLFGRRLAVVSETEGGRRLAESLVKDLTGSDRVRARHLYADNFEFTPTHKIIVATNHPPVIQGTDHGIWRRLRLVPFRRTFWNSDAGESGPVHLRQDKDLPAKLRAEASGILNWLLSGCLEWQQEGMPAPAEVLDAGRAYRASQDTVVRFVEERCETGPDYEAKASELYAAYAVFVRGAGREPVTATSFGRAMAERGFSKRTSNGVRYVGVRVVAEGPEELEGISENPPKALL